MEKLASQWFVCKEDVLQLVRHLLKYLMEKGFVDGVVSGVYKEGKVSLHIATRKEEIDEAPLDYVLTKGYKGLESTAKTVSLRKEARLAALAKPCEVRAMIELAKRRQVNLDSVFVIGFDCPGMRAAFNPEPVLSEAMSMEPSVETIREACKRCEVHAPPYADVNISLLASHEIILVRAGTRKGEHVVEALRGKGIIQGRSPPELIQRRNERLRLMDEKGEKNLKEEEESLLSTPSHERFSWFMSQFNSCIKCCACIRACPLCFCKDCILISDRKNYAPSLFIATRMLHMADSCVCCGKCDEVCPKNLPLSYMFYHLGRKFTSRYGYLAGTDFTKPPRAI